MQSPTSVAIRGLSVAFILFLFSISLHAQNKVVIKERLEINPKSNHTLQADMSSSNFPYFAGIINPGRGDVDPKDYSQSFSVFRPCSIICTGTFESAEPIPVAIIHSWIGPGIANRTDTIRVDCGGVFCQLFNLTECGNFFDVIVTGSISDNLITYTLTGNWCCLVPHYVPFTATATFQAIPISNKEPCTIVMNATRTSFDERMEGPYGLFTNLFPAVCDNSGTQIPYCGPSSMLVTIENPINGTYFIEDPIDITNLGTSRTIENGGCVRFYWDGSDLPDGKDSLDISIKAECIGLSGTQAIQLKKYIYPCLVVKMSKKEMSPGDTAAISLIALKNGTEQSYPVDQEFSVWMNIGEQYGKLYCSSPIDSGSYVYGQQPFIFIAAESIDVDSIVVEIGAREGGGGDGSIGIVTKDTLRLTEPIMASKQGTAKNIGVVSNEMKRKNIELSMNTLQARLNKESEKKGNEKNKQKLALDLEQLKARLAYETAKTPTEKQNALTSIKQIAKISSVQETCNSTVDVTIKKEGEPELVVIYPKDNAKEEKDIDPTPKMPDLSIKAQLLNYDKDVSFYITFTKLQWTAPGTSPQKITTGYFEGNKTGSGEVDIPFTLPVGYIRGGDDITIDVRAVAEGKTYTKTLMNPFKIEGLNPNKSDVCAEISSVAPTTISNYVASDIKMLQIITFLESTFRQFQTSPGFPYQGNEDKNDFGIMQINHPDNDDLIWNWKKNIAGGMGKYNQKKKSVDDYIPSIKNGNCCPPLQPAPQYYYADPKDSLTQIAFNPTPLTEEQKIQEIFQRYNGGVYWRWVPDKIEKPLGSGKWIEDPQKFDKATNMYGGYSIRCMDYYNGKCPCE